MSNASQRGVGVDEVSEDRGVGVGRVLEPWEEELRARFSPAVIDLRKKNVWVGRSRAVVEGSAAVRPREVLCFVGNVVKVVPSLCTVR